MYVEPFLLFITKRSTRNWNRHKNPWCGTLN